MSQNTFVEANKIAFDKLSATYDAEPWQKRLIKQLTEALQSRKEWYGVRWAQNGNDRQVKLLDYACGTGAVSVALRPLVTELRGMDLSEGMVKRYNESMTQLGLTYEQAHAVVQDLVNDTATNVESQGLYDVAVISLALHHVEDPALLINKLAEHVKPKTGVVVVLDFLPFEHAGHGHKHGHGHDHATKGKDLISSMAHTIKQHGFDELQMTELFEQAGMQDVAFDVEKEATVMGEDGKKSPERWLFVAKARRA